MKGMGLMSMKRMKEKKLKVSHSLFVYLFLLLLYKQSVPPKLGGSSLNSVCSK
jgi:hypothetical protein